MKRDTIVVKTPKIRQQSKKQLRHALFETLSEFNLKFNTNYTLAIDHNNLVDLKKDDRVLVYKASLQRLISTLSTSIVLDDAPEWAE